MRPTLLKFPASCSTRTLKSKHDIWTHYFVFRLFSTSRALSQGNIMFDVRNHTRSCLPNGDDSLILLSRLKHKQMGNVVFTKPKYIPFFMTTCLKKKWKQLFANRQWPLLNLQIPGSLRDNVRTQKKKKQDIQRK